MTNVRYVHRLIKVGLCGSPPRNEKGEQPYETSSASVAGFPESRQVPRLTSYGSGSGNLSTLNPAFSTKGDLGASV